jgi:hypothetical protein
METKTYAAGTVMMTFLPVNLEKLIFSSWSLILISTSGTASPALMGEAATSEAKALCAVCAVAASRDANCQRLQRRQSTEPGVDRTGSPAQSRRGEEPALVIEEGDIPILI